MGNRNIWLSPTNQPSRLHLAYGRDYYLSIEPFIQSDTENYKSFDIHITSDEDIKKGSVVLSTYDKWKGTSELKPVIGKVIEIHEDCYLIKYYSDHFGETQSMWDKGHSKIIILTTDDQLIKEGVQAIPDNFFEWFVNNSSCEFVKVDSWKVRSLNNIVFDTTKQKYEIIIPQEKPQKYPIGGYAPGNYICNCSTCKTKFQGDKRAVQCETCAIKMTNKELKQEACIQCDGTGETVFSGTYTTQRTCDVCNGKGYVSLDTIKQAEEDLKLIMSLQKPKQETPEERAWLTIFKEYTKDNESNLFMFFNWLESNYNPPEKIKNGK
jgi:hypothetical protein